MSAAAKLGLVWTERAVQDLDGIADFIAQDDPMAAIAWVDALVAAAEQVGHVPRIGRTVSELGREDVRELIHGGYRIVYRVTSDRVEVLTVFEGHRLLRGLDG